MQIAYQPRKEDVKEYEGDLTRMDMHWNGKHRSCLVNTKTFLGLASNAAWKYYFRNAGIQEYPCLLTGYKVPGSLAVGLGTKEVAEGKGEDVFAPDRLTSKVGAGLNSVLEVWDRDMLKDDVQENVPRLLPTLISLGNYKFVGGSIFWHATRAVFGDNGRDISTTYNADTFKTRIEL